MSFGIDLGSVEEVNSSIETFLNDFFILFIRLGFVVDHITKADDGDFESRVTKVDVLHLFLYFED